MHLVAFKITVVYDSSKLIKALLLVILWSLHFTEFDVIMTSKEKYIHNKISNVVIVIVVI